MKSPRDMKIIQIEITNACVHRCSNCTRFCGHHAKPFFMEYDTFIRAVDSMKGFHGIVGVMGGEPTLHPQFERLVRYFRDHFGGPGCPTALRRPVRDFVGYIVREVFNIHRNNQRGLWSSVGRKYYEHFEIIQDTFGYQAVNDHTNPSMHETLTVTRKELGIPDDEWIKLRDACWIQNIWSASITPKGAFFCEVAAAMDMLFDGPGGWPIEPGWWKRKPEEFGEQLRWCELCSAPLAMPKRDAREGIDDVSPVWQQKLQEVGSPKLRKGLVHQFDVSTYRAADHQVINEALPYLQDQLLRIGEGNKVLYPRDIEAVVVLPSACTTETALAIVDETRRHLAVLAVISANLAHAVSVDGTSAVFHDASRASGRELFEAIQRSAKEWVLLLNGLAASPSLVKNVSAMVYNPGCLYLCPTADVHQDCRVPGATFFNRRALSLRDGADLDCLAASYPKDKVLTLDLGQDGLSEADNSPPSNRWLRRVITLKTALSGGFRRISPKSWNACRRVYQRLVGQGSP